MHVGPTHSKSATSNLQAHFQEAKYPPHVHPNGRVTFRLNAPMAHKVQIEPINGQPENNGYNGLGTAPYDMTKDENGLWSVTTPPAVPGLHGYWLVVDGARVNDTSSKTYGSTKMHACGVEVPEPGVDFYDIKDVPHGQVRLQWYYSHVTKAWRRAYVYVPPDYDRSPGKRYPALYLRHGGGEDETGWVEQGRANFILDNLIAEGEAVPMIVVMDWGQAPTPDQPVHIPSTPPPPEIAAVTINELIPLVDATFRTIPDRGHRAMAGLSMGSVQTLYIGLTHLDTFSYLGVFSRRPMSADEFNVQKSFGGVFSDAAAFNRKVKLFWWGAGTAEEGIYNATKAHLAELAKAGIQAVLVEFPGTSHEWQTWRKCLYDFAPRLFREQLAEEDAMPNTIFRSRPICVNTWLIHGDGCTSYLVVGDERGILIDTGFATENIRTYAQNLTDKPVTIAANTHGHFDHTGGNGWFERAYMSAKALEIAKTPYPSKAALKYSVDYPVTIVGDGDTIDLGNRVLEVLEIPAHAPSSIAFLDRKERIMFTGDEVGAHVMLYWMQPEPQPTVQQHSQHMEKLLKHRKEFDFICAGHGQGLEDAALVETYLEHDRRIMSGRIKGEPMVPRGDAPSDGPDPRDFRMYQIEFKRTSIYRGTTLGYDLRYIHNK